MRNQQQFPRWQKVLAFWALVLLLVTGSFTITRSAHAGGWCGQEVCSGDFITGIVQIPTKVWGFIKEGVATVRKNEALIQFFAGVVKIYNAFQNGMNSVIDMDRLARLMQITTEWLHAHMATRLTDAKIQGDSASNKAAEDYKAALEESHTSADQYLCNVLKLRMMIPIMQQFADMVTDFLGKGMDAVGRGPADLGNSAQHSADYLKMECGDVENYTNKTGNLADQMPERCRALHAVPGASTADAYMDIGVLSLTKTFTLPPVKRQSVTEGGMTYKVSRLNPDPEVETQKGFMMATQFCNTLAGAHPSPVHGAQKFTAASIVKDGRHVDCRTLQYEFSSRCAARIAKLTRPDCSQPEFKAFCDASIEACAAAKTAGLDLAQEYHDCTNGLNLYQLERLSVLMCGSSRRMQSEAAQGTKPGERAPILTFCSQMHDYWKEQIMLEEEGLRAAIRGVMLNRECFAGTGK